MGDMLERAIRGESYLLFDGGMGATLMRKGLVVGDIPDLLCLSHPDEITSVHRSYIEAGAQVATTNTFSSNKLKLDGEATVEQLYAAAVDCARAAGAPYVAADIGPTGELLDPLGDLEFEEACDIFAEQAKAGAQAGADLIIVETMADPTEARAAVTAAKASCDLPVFATMTFAAGGRTLFGASPADAVALYEGLGADAVGVNCSLGPAELEPIVRELVSVASKPVIVQPNAGLPMVVDGETVYSIGADEFAAAMGPVIDAGATILGGCCGTDASFIQALARLLEERGARV